MTADLVAFLRGRLDEDEHTARAASGNQWLSDAGDSPADAWILNEDMHLAEVDPPTAEHIARHDPARVLAEVDAKRRIIAWHSTPHTLVDGFCVEDTGPRTHQGEADCACCGYPNGCLTVRLLVLPYSSHPDYRPEWAPEA